MTPPLLVVVGLKREAQLVAGPAIVTVAGGGDAGGLATKLQALLAADRPRAVISVGLGGALADKLKVGDWVIAERIIGEARVWECDRTLMAQLRPQLADAHMGDIASANVVVASSSHKAALRTRTGALAVDMESYVAAAVALDHGLPFAAVRVVSDTANDTLPPAVLVSMRPDGGLDLPAILWSLVKDFRQLPTLIRTGREAEVAFRKLALLGRHDLLGRLGVGDPDLGQLALDVV